MAEQDCALAERECLILEHIPQVHLIARRIHKRVPNRVALEDLVSAGVMGLISAVDRFDPGKGAKLQTYAEHKIRGAILDTLRDLDWISRERRHKAKRIEAATTAAEQKLHRSASEEEIAQELQLDLAEYRQWRVEVQASRLISLDAGLQREEGGSLLEVVPDSEERWPSHLLEARELERLLLDALEHMPPVERMVLRLYYRQEATLREIAQVMKLHLSRISQLKAQAIVRLRASLRKRWPAGHGRPGR